MTNEQIIAQVAVASGIYTEAEIQGFIENGMEIPLHTAAGWAMHGPYRIKKGEHGLPAKLWKRIKQPITQGSPPELDTAENTIELNRDFYLTKAYLFTREQVEFCANSKRKEV